MRVLSPAGLSLTTQPPQDRGRGAMTEAWLDTSLGRALLPRRHKDFLLDCYAPGCTKRGLQCPRCHRQMCPEHMETVFGDTVCYVCRDQIFGFGRPLGWKQGEPYP